MSDHGYPRNLGLIDIEKPLATNANKGFIIGSFFPFARRERLADRRISPGEYDWTNKFGGVSLASYLAAIEATSYIGDLIWNVQGHDTSCCAYLPHVCSSRSR